ncbi:MAG TPA: GAF domain-containing protein [Actinomycetota bacterium]|nr:GAF domain-containing protein [Actinomycetota bacterium]
MDRRDELIEAGLVLASELSLSAVLQRIIEVAADITGARYGALGVVEDGRLVDFITTGITTEQRRAIGDLPVGHGILGLLIHRGTERTPIRIADISQHQHAYGFPPNHPEMHSFLGAPIVARGDVFGDIYLTEKQGASEFTEEDAQTVLVLASQAGVAIENARLYEETARRERWLDAVREITNAVLAGAGSDEALSLVASRARELVGADLTTVAVPDGGGAELVIRAADGARADELTERRFPVDGSISGAVARSGRPQISEDVSNDTRAQQPVVALGEMGPAVFVPLARDRAAFGTLAAVNRRGGRSFTQDDIRVLEAFGGQAALALEYARAQEGIQRLMLLEDRERIAKELHDGVIQALFAVGMGLQGTALMSSDEDLARRIEAAVGELDRVIRDLRNYIFGLRPGILADRQLGHALRHLAEEFETKSGVVTVVEIDDEVASVVTSHAAELVQLARETLSNVGRHANAATCRLSLRQDGGAAVLEIDDDGNGFDPSTTRRGEGLTNLEGRAAALGGKAIIASVPAQGTTIRIELPL